MTWLCNIFRSFNIRSVYNALEQSDEPLTVPKIIQLVAAEHGHLETEELEQRVRETLLLGLRLHYFVKRGARFALRSDSAKKQERHRPPSKWLSKLRSLAEKLLVEFGFKALTVMLVLRAIRLVFTEIIFI